MEFNPKQPVTEQDSKGVSLEKASFLVGFKAAIDSIGDIEKKGVASHYGKIVDELEITFSKLQGSF